MIRPTVILSSIINKVHSALSTLFAGEWHNDTASLALTAKNGWRELARAKICTGMAFTLELFGLLETFLQRIQ